MTETVAIPRAAFGDTSHFPAMAKMAIYFGCKSETEFVAAAMKASGGAYDPNALGAAYREVME